MRMIERKEKEWKRPEEDRKLLKKEKRKKRGLKRREKRKKKTRKGKEKNKTVGKRDISKGNMKRVKLEGKGQE